jgi:hypothetical protein
MKATLPKIADLLSPPAHPVGAEGNWVAAERRLGAAFPDDFKWFIRIYGVGRVNDFLWLNSPFAGRIACTFWRNMKSTIAVLKRYSGGGIVKDPERSHDFFPRPGGLLPFGNTENNNYLTWRTHGDPNNWHVVVWDPSSLKFREYKDWNFSELLCRLLAGKYPVEGKGARHRKGAIFPAEVFDEPRFQPAEPPSASRRRQKPVPTKRGKAMAGERKKRRKVIGRITMSCEMIQVKGIRYGPLTYERLNYDDGTTKETGLPPGTPSGLPSRELVRWPLMGDWATGRIVKNR